MNIFYIAIDIVVPIMFLVYGYRYITKPPRFNDSRGLKTTLAKTGPEEWKFAQKFGGQLFMIFGVVLAILSIIRYAVFPIGVKTWYDYFNVFAKLVLMVAVPIITDIVIGKKFD